MTSRERLNFTFDREVTLDIYDIAFNLVDENDNTGFALYVDGSSVYNFAFSGMRTEYYTNNEWTGTTFGIFSNSYRGFTIEELAVTGEVSAVPVPAAVWLFGSGLIGLMAVARRKRK
jgi:hypothetical protein